MAFPPLILLSILLPAFGFHTPDSPDGQPPAADLTVHLSGLSPAKGILRFALYRSPNGFMQQDSAVRYSVPVTHFPDMTAVLPKLPSGTYALAVFQDENEDASLDKNLLGIPTEPYAFSGNPPSKWRIPTFEQCSFAHPPPNHAIRIRLNKW